MRHYYNRYRTYRYGWGDAVGLVEDRSGQLWLSTRSELMRFDPATGGFTSFRHDPQNPESINSDLPTAVYRDRSDVAQGKVSAGVSHGSHRSLSSARRRRS